MPNITVILATGTFIQLYLRQAQLSFGARCIRLDVLIEQRINDVNLVTMKQ